MKKNSIFHFLWLISIIFGFVATLMITLPALVYKDTNSVFLGYQVAFGYKFMSLGPWADGKIEFNVINLFAYLLPSFGSAYLLVRKNGYYVAAVSFLVSIMLLALIPFFTTVTVTVLGADTSVNIDWSFGIGLSIAILFSVFALMVSIYIISYRLVKSKKMQ